jgi:hypothetical protein
VTATEARLDAEGTLRAMVDMDQAAITTRLDAQERLLGALALTQSDHARSCAARAGAWSGSRTGSAGVEVGMRCHGAIAVTHGPGGRAN